MDKITEKKEDEEQIIYRFPEMRIEIETFKISFSLSELQFSREMNVNGLLVR